MSAHCQSCGSQMPDVATVCGGCADRVFMELRTVSETLDDLLTTLTRQDKIGDREGGRRSTETPLPFREQASEAAWVLHAVLLAWVRVLSESDSPMQSLIGTTDRGRYANSVELALWLLRHRDTFRRHEQAATAVDELLDAVRVARRAVDRPAALVYRGPCDGCNKDLYVPAHLSEVTCRACGATYDAAARRAWLVERIDGHLATAAEIARGVSTLLGKDVPVNNIHQWHSRERLFPKGYDRRGRPLFAVGDVVTLALASPERKPRKRSA